MEYFVYWYAATVQCTVIARTFNAPPLIFLVASACLILSTLSFLLLMYVR